MGRPTFTLVDPHPLKMPKCEAKRGGPRSVVKCERPLGHAEEHIGRGRIGQWFVWGQGGGDGCEEPGCHWGRVFVGDDYMECPRCQPHEDDDAQGGEDG